MNRSKTPPRSRVLGPLLFALAVAATPARAGVKVALLPATQTVAPGAEFDLSVEVTRTGSPFNGFDVYIGYDPAALTLIPTSPLSLQEGSYFKAACANRFHLFMAGAGRDTITDVLLCAGVALTGPGQIYKLHFKAATHLQVTTVHFLAGLQFYNDGRFVSLDGATDAQVGIGMQVGVEDSLPKARTSRLLASPNPARDGTIITVEVNRPGAQELLMCDLQGRAVRHLQSGAFPAGIRTVHWDGRNDSGVVMSPGVYLATLRAPGKVLEARVTLLR